MINENMIEAIKKSSYYCQSCYTSIHLFNELVENRKLDVLDGLLMKIIESISNLMKFYSEINLDTLVINSVNQKLELIIDGYSNLDYFYIKDVFEYEILPVVEKIFSEIKYIISNETK